MNTSTHTFRYVKFMMLSGMILISALYAEQAYSTTVTTLLNANHRVELPGAIKVNGIYYIPGQSPTNTTMRVDYKGVAHVQRDYTLDAAKIYFFRTGERSISSYSRVGNSSARLGRNPPERLADIRLDFRKACGLKGGITSFVRLRNKATGAYVRIVQGPREIPYAGGIVPVAIDCRVPTISRINGETPDRFNQCVVSHGSYGLSIKMADDIGIRDVEVRSNNRALRISPSRIGSAHIRKASGKNLFTADFSMRAVNANPINRVGITAKVRDMAGHRKEYHFNINLAGYARNAFRVNLAPFRVGTVGRRTAFGGTLRKQSCDSGEQYMWQIIKVPGRTSTRAQSIVAHTGGGGYLKPRGPRTPFIAVFTPAHAGFYRLQFLDTNNTLVYTSPALEIMDTVRRGVTPPKPARRYRGPSPARRF